MVEPRELQVGELVQPGAADLDGLGKDYAGRFVSLRPVNPAADAEVLFDGAHGSPEIEQLWAYMAYGPFADVEAMRAWLEGRRDGEDPLFLTVHSNELGHPVGMVSFMNIVPEMRCLELGNIWYTPDAQRTKANTEAAYLMLCEAFDRGCRRVEWKCDALNERSRAAALRLGFTFEGVFRKHMIIKGRNRDTAWFAMTDDEWPRVRANMERWLYAADGGLSLSLLNTGVIGPA